MMRWNILFVDDEPRVLAAYKRHLRKLFNVNLAASGEQALGILASQSSFAVIISDMRMPKMNGIELLSKVKKLDPDIVRIMLTGYADQETAITAVNEGSIFRFLTKPCPPELLVKTIEAGIKQYQLVVAERELLEQTLHSSIRVLTEILSLVNPAAFSRSARIKRYVKQIVERLQLPGGWQFELAAMLSQIGCVTLHTDTINKIYSGVSLDKEEEELFANHPKVGSNLLANIPRLETVAQIIASQQRPINRRLNYDDLSDNDLIVLGGYILKIVLTFDHFLIQGLSATRALQRLRTQFGTYTPEIIEILTNLEMVKPNRVVKSIYLKELRTNMIMDQDIRADNGALLVSRGQEVTYPVMERLRAFTKWSKVVEPFRVIVPDTTVSLKHSD